MIARPKQIPVDYANCCLRQSTTDQRFRAFSVDSRIRTVGANRSISARNATLKRCGHMHIGQVEKTSKPDMTEQRILNITV